MLIGDKEKKQELQESEKGLSINCKKPEWMVVRKRNSRRSELKIADTEIKQVQFKYLRSVLRDDGKCNTKFRRRIWDSERWLPKAKQSIKKKCRWNKEDYWTVTKYQSSYIALDDQPYLHRCRRVEGIETWLYRRMLRIQRTEYVSNDEVLENRNKKDTYTYQEGNWNMYGA